MRSEVADNNMGTIEEDEEETEDIITIIGTMEDGRK